MKALSLPFLCRLGSALDALVSAKGDKPVNETWRTVWDAMPHLENLLSSFPLTVCSREGYQLLASLKRWDNLLDQWVAGGVSDPEKTAELLADLNRRTDVIATRAKEFQTVLLAELDTLRGYLVMQKGIYATSELIEHAEKALPPSVITRIPEDAIKEMQESGKCFAFECSTAAGFHILRASEVVLHHYYLACCKPASQNMLGSWAEYIAELRKCQDASVKEVVALIQQIKDVDRNPIMHPLWALTSEEAFRLFELCKSAIMLMAAKLPDVEVTPPLLTA